ncbi:hypothetical protein PAESOLCIP111_05576 [Paenibacillus solanacearum]|uniref:Uncharacterized protein n=1 Tax=Paenibacillus solanacearum TaxID=2048548 RepID=A0A916K7R1_9BACL|nr:hypothetical protein [Paenibacillus solanacearum]CAG7648335.1 hypothetical protein PAESOLCIP111_05576 [Paenibacillus solanacearum]
MDTSRLKSLRVKQIIFINACVCIIIPLTGGLLLVLEPSRSDTYLIGVFLYGVVLLFECWSLFFPKHLLFMHGPRFMREIAEYEREKLGKNHDRKGRIVRLFGFTFLLVNQLVAFTRIRDDDPMQIRDVSGLWTIMAALVLIFILLSNAAILYRIHKIDRTEPGQFRWFTLKSLALGIMLGLVAVLLLSVGFGIALH